MLVYLYVLLYDLIHSLRDAFILATVVEKYHLVSTFSINYPLLLSLYLIHATPQCAASNTYTNTTFYTICIFFNIIYYLYIIFNNLILESTKTTTIYSHDTSTHPYTTTTQHSTPMISVWHGM